MKQGGDEAGATFKTTVRFPAALHKELRLRAITEGCTFEGLVVELIQKGLKAEQVGPKRKR